MATLLFTGGFFEYSAALGGLLLTAAVFLILCVKGKISSVFRSLIPAVPALVILWMLPVSFWAADRYRNLAGVFRFSPLILWIFLIAQFDGEERREIFNLIPISGAVMTVLGGIMYLIPSMRGLMWMSDRFGGNFQYSNTCALYLLAGIVVLVPEEGDFFGGVKVRGLEKSRKGSLTEIRALRFGILLLLVIGLLLTGSRSILILGLFWGVYKAVRIKRIRIPYLIIAGGSLLAGYLMILLTGSRQNLGRIFTTFTLGSTFWGRLLYMKDALKILMAHPFGLGFQGYYYVQPLYQNGVYQTMYVHNDYLQLMLDAGIIPGLLMIAWLIFLFAKKKVIPEYRELLILILLSSLFDFGMQYLMIPMCAILCVDPGLRADKSMNPSEKLEGRIGCGLLFLLYAVLIIPFSASRLGNDELEMKFFPHDTEAELRLLSGAQNADTAEYYASDLLKHNPYAADAHRHLAYISLMKGDYEGALDHMDDVIRINRYHLKEYEAYDKILDEVLTGADLSSPIRERALHTKEELPKILSALRETTDPLAWKLRDQPVFEMWK
ncbi:MAG: O-antigen ligase family protein [Lachnospiraceae bacterium]|nr:O-antigen ligase family protein [Lachnospiraceae bacterium]